MIRKCSGRGFLSPTRVLKFSGCWTNGLQSGCKFAGTRRMRFFPNPLRSLTKFPAMLACCAVTGLTSAWAGQEIASKEVVETLPTVEPAYEGGRGLLTLQGPSGMF